MHTIAHIVINFHPVNKNVRDIADVESMSEPCVIAVVVDRAADKLIVPRMPYDNFSSGIPKFTIDEADMVGTGCATGGIAPSQVW